jgi:hypothetical protein
MTTNYAFTGHDGCNFWEGESDRSLISAYKNVAFDCFVWSITRNHLHTYLNIEIFQRNLGRRCGCSIPLIPVVYGKPRILHNPDWSENTNFQIL